MKRLFAITIGLFTITIFASQNVLAEEISFERDPSNPLYIICSDDIQKSNNDGSCEKRYVEKILYNCFQENAFGSDLMGCNGKGRAICSVVTRFNDTLGLNYCAKYSFEVWESILSEEFQKALSVAENLNELNDLFPLDQIDRGSLSASLEKAQRDWLTYRESECSFIFHQYSSGTARVSYYQNCRIAMTAERAIRLKDAVLRNSW